MNWTIFLLLSILVLLSLSWVNVRRRQPAKAETLVYLQGRNAMNNPDSDADMQEQYDFRKNTNNP
ncbi:hypothetical protein [Ammoniphilus sp. 3BR4]|uniref:hypothetical protein n=1 Tax=Ammoniphilus sp. 3BR4 TaxID=3158265 RepID=UPI003465FD6A